MPASLRSTVGDLLIPLRERIGLTRADHIGDRNEVLAQHPKSGLRGRHVLQSRSLLKMRQTVDFGFVGRFFGVFGTFTHEDELAARELVSHDLVKLFQIHCVPPSA